MMSKVATSMFFVTVSVFLASCDDRSRVVEQFVGSQMTGLISGTGGSGIEMESASPVESISDRLNALPFTIVRQLGISHEIETQSCDLNETAVITVYSTNAKAQSEIDVKIDGSPIGSLTTYFPHGDPACKSPSAEGVITLLVPAGNHTLEAVSPNLTWPRHHFSVEKCECLLMPLS